MAGVVSAAAQRFEAGRGASSGVMLAVPDGPVSQGPSPAPDAPCRAGASTNSSISSVDRAVGALTYFGSNP